MRKVAAWSAALEGVARTAWRRELGQPLVLPTAPPTAATAPGSPATLLSLTRPRRRVTIAMCPRALAVPGAQQQRSLVVVIDLDGVGVGPHGPLLMMASAAM